MCEEDANGAVLRIAFGHGKQAEAARTVLRKGASEGPPTYGFHFFDLALTQGSVLDLIRTESQAYLKAHAGGSSIRTNQQ
jgi:hypothetical protein